MTLGWSAGASTKENVLIQAGDCTLSLLPEFGGKIASLRLRGQELLQEPLVPIAARSRTMGFEESDASGWDECLPSVSACTVPIGAARSIIPDHGDLWRVPWEMVELTNQAGAAANSVTLRGTCFSLPLVLERQLKLGQTDSGWRLNLRYKLTNTGQHPIPWSWAAHPLFAAAPGDRVILPDSVKTLRLEWSANERLGKKGDFVGWPVPRLPDNASIDLSVAQPLEAGSGDKLFAGPLGAHENWCVLERPSAGVRIRVSFDCAATPYLGLWICYGGWPERPGNKQVCVAMEPATAPVDSLSVAGPWSRMLPAGDSYVWPMYVDLQVI